MVSTEDGWLHYVEEKAYSWLFAGKEIPFGGFHRKMFLQQLSVSYQLLYFGRIRNDLDRPALINMSQTAFTEQISESLQQQF